MSSRESITNSLEDGIYLSKDDSANDTCSICLAYEQEGRLKSSRHDEVTMSAAVHQICSECDAFEVDERQLCDFCIHIRPAHLMTCMCVLDLGVGRHTVGYRTRHSIVIGTLSELESRQGSCAFCQWCLQVIQADAQLYQLIIDERKAIRIERLIHEEKEDLFSGHELQASISIIFKVRRSNSADGGDGKSWDKCISIGHDKEFASSPHTFEDETLVGSGRNIPLITSVADWAAVRRWKSRCEQEHETCGERAAGTLPDHFRLIDVAKKRIIDADKNPPPFFALSYVWGAHSKNGKELLSNNLDKLQRPGSLHNLPRTIADAMHVCEQLGQPFLWVDQLCIIQNDKEDKYGQIRSLEAIYSRAELVIIAACGDDMQSRLAGVNGESSRGKIQFVTDVFGFTMANKAKGFEDALRCKWNERGWTYQEAVLARRKLYFTPAELWFECAEGLERENPFSATRTQDKIHRGNHLTAYGTRDVHLSSGVFEEYGHHVDQYNQRVLTYPSDIYHAFHGIEDAFYPECQIIFGLPEFDFNRALLWYPNDTLGLEERRCSDRDIVLPSWSWTSLRGSVEYCKVFGNDHIDTGDNHGSFYYSLCNWAVLGGKDQQTLVPINSIHDEKVWTSLDKLWSYHPVFRGHPTHRQFLALAWTKGCIEADVPTDLFQPDIDPGQLQPGSIISAKDLALRWPIFQDFRAEVRDRKQHKHDHPQPIDLNKGHILTRTQSSVMNVKLTNTQSDHLHLRTVLIQHAHTPSGYGENIGWISSEDEFRLRGTPTREGTANMDFIAMAIGYLPHYDAQWDPETRKKNRFYHNQSEYSHFNDSPGVIVMAVRWDGQVARRIALGWVTLQGWVDSKPEFRNVILA